MQLKLKKVSLRLDLFKHTNLFKSDFAYLNMSLQNLLDPDFIVPVLAGAVLLHRIDSYNYNLFKDNLSFSKEDFNKAQENEEYIENVLQRAGMLDEDSRILNATKASTIGIYESFADKKVPKFLLFSRPFFYFQAKKEINYMKEESEERLKDLQAA